MSASQSLFPLLTSQRSPFERVVQLLKVGMAKSSIGSFRVRTYPLLMASSGVGKTEIVKRACEELGMVSGRVY